MDELPVPPLPGPPLDSLRRLARGLLFDRASADDVVQEAWLAALRRGPAQAALGGWLAEAVRRIARSSGRAERRREAREQRAARPEALPSTAEATGRIEILRALLDAVDALDEPYRTAIVLRYFDELPPRAIAQKLGVPVNTARTHVRRGLERLRRQLDGERGDRREELLAALVPFAGPSWARGAPLPPSLAVASTWIGGLLVKKTFALAVAAVLVAGFVWVRGRGARESGAASAPDAPREIALQAAVSQDDPPAERTAPASTREAPVREPAAAETGWTVRGYVQRGYGAPYPGARLVGRVFAGTAPEGTPLVDQRFTADEHGEFAWTLPAPPAEMVTVFVEPVHDGQRAYPVWDVFLPGDAPPSGWRVNAYPYDGVLHGTVRDTEGRAVPGARAVYQKWIEMEDVREVRTDAEGRFELPFCSPRTDLTVIAPGFAVAEVDQNHLEPGEQTVDVVLEREKRVRGRVVDEAGAPVDGALVSATIPLELAAVTSGPDGRFELGGFGASDRWKDQWGGGQVTLWFAKSGYATCNGSVLRERFDEEQELVLKRGIHVAGRVVDSEGMPLPGTWVSRGYSAFPKAQTYTDEDGRFELGPLHPGKLELWFWRNGYAQLRHDVEVPPEVPRREGLEIVLQPPHFLAGTVVDPSGAPVPSVFVFAEDAEKEDDARLDGFSTYSDRHGRFRFDGLPDVPLRLGTMEVGYARSVQDVPGLDRDDVVVRLHRGAILAGRVVDDASGTPIPGFTVRIVQDLDRGTGASYPGESERTFDVPDGVWHLADDLAVGRIFFVEVRAAGFAPAYRQVTSAVDADPDACLVRLKRGASVRGRVVERETQRPVAGARVVQRSQVDQSGFDRTPVETRTDADGRFELVDLAPETMLLRVEAGDLGAVDGPIELSGQETIERWIEVGGRARISGRLLDPAGNGIAGATVSLYGRETATQAGFHRATTTETGGYAFAELPPGWYQLQWERELKGARAADLLQHVSLDGGENVEVDLRPRGGATLRGTVTAAHGPLPEAVPVYLGPAGKKTALGWPDGQRGAFAVGGRFEVPALESGSWSVNAYTTLADGTQLFGHVQVEVPADGAVEVAIALQARQ